jgi:hypothetical protein
MDERCKHIATQRPDYVPGPLFITARRPSPSPRPGPHAPDQPRNPLVTAT